MELPSMPVLSGQMELGSEDFGATEKACPFGLLRRCIRHEGRIADFRCGCGADRRFLAKPTFSCQRFYGFSPYCGGPVKGQIDHSLHPGWRPHFETTSA
jgi:hypothetical protein